MAGVAVRLRRAEPADAERLWQWRNDPETRQASLDGQEIPFERHLEWLEAQLRSADVALYIIEGADRRPCGQVRLNRQQQGGALVSIGLAREARGQGLGVAALREILLAAHRPDWATPLYAVIRDANAASRRAFEAAGFTGPSAEAAAAVGPLEQGTGVWIARPDSE